MRHWLKALAPLLLLLALAAPAAARADGDGVRRPDGEREPRTSCSGRTGTCGSPSTAAAWIKLGRVTPGNPPVIDEFPLPAGLQRAVQHHGRARQQDLGDAQRAPRGRADRALEHRPTSSGTAATACSNPAARNRRRAGRQDLARLTGRRPGAYRSARRERGGRLRLRGDRLHTSATSPTARTAHVWVTDFGGPNRARHARRGRRDVRGPGRCAPGTSSPDPTATSGTRSRRATTRRSRGMVLDGQPPSPQYDVTDAGDQLGNTVGPDGALWFAQAVAERHRPDDARRPVLRVRASPPAARPEYIAAGPDEHALVHGEGRQPDRADHRDRRRPQRGPPPPPPDTTKPDVTRFRITRKRFRAGGLGTVIKWTQSEDGRDTISFERRVKGRWRKVRRKMRFQSTAGNQKLRFRGRFDLKHPLKPGRYRMTLTAAMPPATCRRRTACGSGCCESAARSAARARRAADPGPARDGRAGIAGIGARRGAGAGAWSGGFRNCAGVGGWGSGGIGSSGISGPFGSGCGAGEGDGSGC